MPRSLLLYLLLTFATSWALWLASGVLAYGGALPPLDRGWLTAQIGVFCPSLWALVFVAVQRPERRRQCLLLAGGLYLPAALLGGWIARYGLAEPGALPLALRGLVVAAALIALAVIVLPRGLLLAGRRRLDGRVLGWLAAAALTLPLLFLLAWLLVGRDGGYAVGRLGGPAGALLPTLAVLFAFDTVFGGALGEELGWRGYLLPQLLARWSPLRAALALAVAWALWHLPIDLQAGFGAVGLGGVLFRLLFTGALSVIVTWFYVRSGHGLAAAFLIHATVNWLPVLEFSGYETAMALLFLFMLLLAAAVGFGDAAMRREPGQPER